MTTELHPEPAIEVAGLTKRYRGHTAVDDVTFSVRPGRITGFLGPNGAGKSTTMRMMVGLTPSTSGHSKILGRTYRELPNPGRHVGVLLDASAQHSGRSGRETLAVAATVLGLDESRVDEVIELVGLTPAEAKRRTGTYSLGMRQRLGVGHALVGDPSVLVLDEPANGLDPAGIHWMRGLFRDYAARGGTVLLSSHLLREIEVIADELVVIGHGKVIAQGTKDELLTSDETYVCSNNDAALTIALEQAGIDHRPSPRRWLPHIRPRGRRRSRRARRRDRDLGASPSRRRGTRGVLPDPDRRCQPRDHRGSSTMTITHPTGVPAEISAVPFSRMLRAELRKLTNTRAGRWLLAAILAATPIVTVVLIFVPEPKNLTYASLVDITSAPQKWLLPILGILTITSEWSQRTGLLTFTLEPDRARVLTAKAAATGLLGLVVLALTFGFSAVGNIVGSAAFDGDGSWDGSLVATRDISIVLATTLAQGLAFGMLFLISAAAIVAFYLLPTVSGIIFGPQFGLTDLGEWVDLNQGQGQLYDHNLSAQDWAQVATSALIWVGVPALLGVRRVLRAEIKTA
ncbi:MAG: ABC transporter ATP-binding protein [Nocardioides sp.]